LIQRLEAAGIDLASFTDVVLTHMHMDHIGGLLIDGVKDRLRPDLRIHVAAAELKFWESPEFLARRYAGGIPGRAAAAAKRFVTDYRSRLRPFEEEHEWRRAWLSVAPAAIRPGTVWSAWRPAATG